MTTISARVSAFIIDNLLLGREEDLTAVPSLLEAGIVDSTGILELVQFLEETWGIRVQDDEMTPDNLDSIERIVRFIERKAPHAAPAASAATLASA